MNLRIQTYGKNTQLDLTT